MLGRLSPQIKLVAAGKRRKAAFRQRSGCILHEAYSGNILGESPASMQAATHCNIEPP